MPVKVKKSLRFVQFSAIFVSLFLLFSCQSGYSFRVPGESEIITKNIASEYFSIAEEYFKLKNYQKAIQYYKLAMKDKSLNVSAYYDGVNSDGDVTFTGGTAEVRSIRKDAVQGLTVKLIGATLTCRAKRADKATPVNLVKDETSVFTALGLN